MSGWLGSAGSRLTRRGASGEVTVSAQPFARLLDLDLVHVLEEDNFLFLRLRPSYSGGSPAP